MRTWINLIENAHTSDFIEEVLYHGSQTEFDQFDLAKNRTARDIYTSPDINTAGYYGSIIYECRVRGPQIDITGTDTTEPEGWDILRKVAAEYTENYEEELKHGQPEWGERYQQVHDARQEAIARMKATNIHDEDYDDLQAEWDSEDDATFKEVLRAAAVEEVLEAIVNGNLYETSSRRQDDVLSEIFAMGYASIRFTDPNSEGQSLSVVVKSPDDIRILRRVR